MDILSIWYDEGIEKSKIYHNIDPESIRYIGEDIYFAHTGVWKSGSLIGRYGIEHKKYHKLIMDPEEIRAWALEHEECVNRSLYINEKRDHSIDPKEVRDTLKACNDKDKQQKVAELMKDIITDLAGINTWDMFHDLALEYSEGKSGDFMAGMDYAMRVLLWSDMADVCRKVKISIEM